jgi:hypothetical protein
MEDLSFFSYNMEDLRYAAVGIKEAQNQSRLAELAARSRNKRSKESKQISRTRSKPREKRCAEF